MVDISTATDSRDSLGEAPVWCVDQRVLFWTDWAQNLIHRLIPASGRTKSWRLDERIGSLVLREGGGAVLALQSGFSFFDFDSGTSALIVDPDPEHPKHELNDGKCDRRGRFWAGTMVSPLADLPADLKDADKGAVFRLDADLSCHAILRGLLIPNGFAWSPDDRTIYFGDSGTASIFKAPYDIDNGRLGEVSVFAEIAGGAVPDGSTVDVDGCLWNAEYGGSRLVRYDPHGRIDRVVQLPVTYPTSCTFGGDRLDLLYVTTAKWRLTPDRLAAEPLAGAVLAIDVGVGGLPDAKFTG
jgi:sugar lactone lactonase YvrE